MADTSIKTRGASEFSIIVKFDEEPTYGQAREALECITRMLGPKGTTDAFDGREGSRMSRPQWAATWSCERVSETADVLHDQREILDTMRTLVARGIVALSYPDETQERLREVMWEITADQIDEMIRVAEHPSEEVAREAPYVPAMLGWLRKERMSRAIEAADLVTIKRLLIDTMGDSLAGLFGN